MSNYIILQDDFPEDLQRQVNLKIDDGYAPLGGVSVSVYRKKSDRWWLGASGRTEESGGLEYVYAQAMSRTDSNSDEKRN